MTGRFGGSARGDRGVSMFSLPHHRTLFASVLDQGRRLGQSGLWRAAGGVCIFLPKEILGSIAEKVKARRKPAKQAQPLPIESIERADKTHTLRI
jgi:hypothetical protein